MMLIMSQHDFYADYWTGETYYDCYCYVIDNGLTIDEVHALVRILDSTTANTLKQDVVTQLEAHLAEKGLTVPRSSMILYDFEDGNLT